MSKENIIDMAHNVANLISKRSVTQNLPQMKSMEIPNAGLLGKLGLSWLPASAAGFYLNSKQIKILHEPKMFYNVLLDKCKKAQERIVLASLYLGTSNLEKNLVSVINQELAHKPNLKVKVLLDSIRGSRGEINSRKMLLPLLQNHENSCQISLYQTPALRGPIKPFLPHKYKEILGLQHIKVYLFDNDLIISGANLSSDYFTERQDRYMVIEDCKYLADFIEGLVDRVSECSFQLNANDKLTLHKYCEHHPSEKPKNFYSAAHNHIWNYYQQFVGEKMNNTDENDTVIFPLIEMGPFGIHLDSTTTLRILKDSSPLSVMHLTTGYFNLTDAYADAIINKSDAKYFILMSHPTTNGFYNAKGPAGGVPFAYTDIATKFWNKVMANNQDFRIKMFEYQRPGWTYHAKGLWVIPENSHLPCLTLIGSPNFGERSVKHDLECQFLIASTNKKLQEDFQKERDMLYKLSESFSNETIRDPNRQPPLWVKMVVWLFRSYL